MASGNQMCNGNMADLPAPPMKMSAMAQAATEQPMKVMPAVSVTSDVGFDIRVWKSNVSVKNERIRIPIRKPRSAKRVTIKAFFEADTAAGLV